MKKTRQVIAILLILIFVLSGCSNSRNSSEKDISDNKIDIGNTEYDFSFYIYQDGRTFTETQLAIQSNFEDFLHELFVDEMTSLSSINLHFTIEHPENYGIDKLEPGWGEFNYMDTSEDEAEITQNLNELTAFDYDALTYEQQLIYDILKEYLEDEQGASEYLLFYSAFGPMSGLQSELPIIFSEYDLLEKSDIDDYISLLNSCYSYVETMCQYELYRMEQGYANSNYSIDNVIDQCNEFISANPNCLRPVFEDKLKGFDGLTDEEISRYMEQFDKGFNESLIPAYKNIITTLETIKKSNPSKGGRCNYDNGKAFYEYLVKNETGSWRSIDELYKMINTDMLRCSGSISKLFKKNPSLINDMESYQYSVTDPSEMLNGLIKALEGDFPAAVNDNYTINYVPESLESAMNPAYYLIPPIDNLNKNNIYINNYEGYAHMNLFPTIAHEGFPGHMYQTTYFYSQNPHYIRSLLDFNGYVEGWAEYVEFCYSYKYSGMDDYLAKAFEYNSLFSFGIYCICDIGINYQGWNYEDTADYLEQYGLAEEEMEEIYYTMVDEPAVYLRYYIGYLEIANLKKDAMKKLGSAFDVKEFHRFLLEIGPCQYDIISDRMDGWINRAMKKS